MLSAGYISAVLAKQVTGPGSVYVSQTLNFRHPVRIGDEVTAIAKITAIDLRRGRVTLDTRCVVGDKTVVKGEAVVIVPKRPA
jgi:3-hydroxybutyryl-CoA dehydratase